MQAFANTITIACMINTYEYDHELITNLSFSQSVKKIILF